MSAYIKSALAAIAPQPLTRLLYRGVAIHSLRRKDPPEALFLGQAANRYNPKGYRTLYFGEDFVSSYSETVQEQGGLLLESPTREVVTAGTSPGVDIARPEPIILFGVVTHVNGVLDLGDDGIRTKLGVSLEGIRGPWRWEYSKGIAPMTHQIGVEVFDSGRFEAIRYPSSKVNDRCCWVIFTDRLKVPSFLEVADTNGYLSGRLP